MSKFKNKKVDHPKYGVFDSIGEYNRFLYLLERQDKGEITNLQRQVVFELIPKTELPRPRKNRHGRCENVEKAVTYVADFVYLDKNEGRVVVEDFKGIRTDVYNIKRKLMLYQKGIQIDEVY